MHSILHVLTANDRTLARSVIDTQKNASGVEIQVVDLSADKPDYQRLLEQIFAADSVQVW